MSRRLALALVTLLLAGPALAQDSTAEAKRLYVSGTKHFNLTEYEEALNDFKEGYRHKEDPVFLYNIAQCYRLLKGHEEDAVKFYKNYLRQVPNAANRDEVERKIATLEQALVAQEKARTAPPSLTMRPAEPVTVVAQPPKKPVYKQWWLWTAVGGAVVAVGLGVGLGVGLSSPGAGQTQLPPVNY